jgi:hypothetical protein
MASLAAELLRAYRAQATPVAVCVESPHGITPQVGAGADVFPLADLRHLAAERSALPVHLLGDHVEHVAQLRWISECPGILVLAGGRLPVLEKALQVQIGTGTARSFLPEVASSQALQAGLLAAMLGNASRLVVVPDAAAAALLRDTGVSTPVEVVAELEAGGASAAAALRKHLDGCAARAIPRPPAAPLQAWPRLPRAEAVIVSYNSKSIIAPCLETLQRQDYPALQVTVIDNASADGTAAFIRERFPQVQVVDSGSNLGFAGGNNLAFARSTADYFVLLNQDALARRNWVTELVRVAELDTSIAAVGAKMLMDRCPTILNSTGIEINEGGWAWDRQVGERDTSTSPFPEEVFGGCGGALLLRRAALQDVGGFDTKFFMYFEDTDLCWRLRLCGWRNMYAPLAVVRHDFHGDSGVTPGRALRRRYMSERNHLLTLVKNADRKHLRQMVPRLWRHDRGRVQWLRRAVAEGNNPEFHRELAALVRRAWRWNLLRLPSTLWRRRKVQRQRRVAPSEVRRFMLAGINEGGHQGDVERYYDRHSAKARACFQMGKDDDGVLGAGWHGVEHPPGAVQPYRWTKGQAWFYLRPQPEGRQLVLKAASPLRKHTVRVFAGGDEIGTTVLDQDVREVAFALRDSVFGDGVVEFRLESEHVRPSVNGAGGDVRELGVLVFEAAVR